MKLSSIAIILNKSFRYVINTSKYYNIDESHALKHSLDVFQNANKIYNSEIKSKPYLCEHKNIIYISSIIHDMCDKKYVDDEMKCLEDIENNFKDLISEKELDVVLKIISTMSYSKVKKYGYPSLGEYQCAYHTVREADLLSGYDFDRCLMYRMAKSDMDFSESMKESIKIFENRILTYVYDNLFISRYSINKSVLLHSEAKLHLKNMKELNSALYNN